MLILVESTMDKYALNTVFDTEKELEHFPKIIQNLLLKRDIKTKKEADKFLNPDYDNHLHNPFLMADMGKAVSRIFKAIDNQEKIIIYSDYDADGIPGAVILHDFFTVIGYKNFENYIPDRHNEGFGLNIKAIEKFSEGEVGLIITIDCGIADVDQASFAQNLGIDVIITDHHEPNGKLPEAYAVINPKHPKGNYPFPMLCGAAVAFKLVQAIILKNNNHFKWKEGQEKWLLDMAGLATLSDMVPLVDENRVLARYGLTVLRKSRRLGLISLLRKLRIDQRYLSEDDITFMITPRINAASRIGDPWDAFRLLSTKEFDKAKEMSDHLNKINDERKHIVAQMAKEIHERIKKDEDGKFEKIIIMGNPEWRPSLLGLVASNLVEKLGKPVFLWGRDGEKVIKGSFRSVDNLDLISVLNFLPKDFMQFGGHKMAGGFSISSENIHFLQDNIFKVYEEFCLNKDVEKEKTIIDSTLSVDEISWETFENIDKLSPFGVGNKKPIFLLEKLEVESVRQFGKQKKHLELSFASPKLKHVKAIAFFVDLEDYKFLRPSMNINLVASLEKYIFLGKKSLRLRIEDVFIYEG